MSWLFFFGGGALQQRLFRAEVLFFLRHVHRIGSLVEIRQLSALESLD